MDLLALTSLDCSSGKNDNVTWYVILMSCTVILWLSDWLVVNPWFTCHLSSNIHGTVKKMRCSCFRSGLYLCFFQWCHYWEFQKLPGKWERDMSPTFMSELDMTTYYSFSGFFSPKDTYPKNGIFSNASRRQFSSRAVSCIQWIRVEVVQRNIPMTKMAIVVWLLLR